MEVLGDHDWVGHGVFWQEVLHVPLIIRFPGGTHAATIDAPVQHVDILPTLLSALDQRTPAGVQGLDLMPLIRGTRSNPASRLLAGQREGDVVVRFDDAPRWKIMFKAGAREPRDPELYDLRADPGETRNLFRRKRDTFDQLHARYARWSKRQATKDEQYRGEATPIQREDLEMLRALGYVGDDEDPTTSDG